MDDDVFGIVSLSEIICVLCDNNFRLKCFVVLMVYVVEEVGLWGL